MLDARHLLVSTDGTLEVEFSLENGTPYYSLKQASLVLIKKSKLGLRIVKELPLGEAMKIIHVTRSHVDTTWEQTWGQQRYVADRHEELCVTLQEIGQRSRVLVVRMRLFDDGFAFRYELPYQDVLRTFEIADELTEFNVDTSGVAWWIPAYQPDRYEYLYQKSQIHQLGIVHTPLTIKTDSNVFLSIHEASLYNYGSMTIQGTEHGLKADITPLANGTRASLLSPAILPWRTIIVSATAPGLVTSTMMLNLNSPPDESKDFSWVRPLKFMGIWWGMFTGEFTWATGARHGATTENAKRYIDYCVRYGIQGLLIEGWNVGWDGNWMENGDLFQFTTPTPDFDIEAICRYAKQNSIELIGHHETSGNVANYETQLPEAFAYYQKLGIRYVKLGYVGSRMNHAEFHHSQFGVRHYQKMIELAATYNIMLDIHEPIKGTGIERTWPNVLTREGGRGQEYEGGGITTDHVPNLVFTRGIAGPFDYTPGIFDITNYSKRVTSTLARQLALYVLIYSPMQMVADTPEQFDNNPAFSFIQDVPVDWSLTLPLGGEIGEYAVIARKDRHSEDWYIGTATNEEARVLDLELSFLDPNEPYIAHVYKDGVNAHWRDNQKDITIEHLEVRSTTTLSIRLAHGGGAAIRITRSSERNTV